MKDAKLIKATKTLFYNSDAGIGGFGSGGAISIAVVNCLATGVDIALTDITIG